MSNDVDTFTKRLGLACSRAQVPLKATALGIFLKISKQTAHTWINGTVPRADALYKLADALGVDPRWLATGQGDMLPRPTSLDSESEQLMARYSGADPRWRLAIRFISYVATERQPEQAFAKSAMRNTQAPKLGKGLLAEQKKAKRRHER